MPRKRVSQAPIHEIASWLPFCVIQSHGCHLFATGKRFRILIIMIIIMKADERGYGQRGKVVWHYNEINKYNNLVKQGLIKG